MSAKGAAARQAPPRRAGGRRGRGGERGDEARRRAAVELVARHEATLKRTARRFSLDAEDAEDAYQRALEIVLVKAPTTDPRDLIRWTQTVTRHEALAIRQSRERLLGKGVEGDPGDPVASLPAGGEGPEELAERREDLARSREAMRALKPAELRALGLLAEGYSYAEIGEITGFSQTKVNRVLAEGRSRFRDLVSRSEDGSRCRELRPLLSAFCDGEAGPADAATVREHLRACPRCRATMRAFRSAPRIAAALAPALPASRSLLERARDLLDGLASHLPGGGGAEAAAPAAAGGSGAGVAAAAKLLAVCAAGAGGAAACVATGVVPAPLGNAGDAGRPGLEREAEGGAAAEEAPDVAAPKPSAPRRGERPKRRGDDARRADARASTGAVEYAAPPPAAAPEPVPEPPAPPPPAPAEPAPSPPGGGSAAGEFGP